MYGCMMELHSHPAHSCYRPCMPRPKHAVPTEHLPCSHCTGVSAVCSFESEDSHGDSSCSVLNTSQSSQETLLGFKSTAVSDQLKPYPACAHAYSGIMNCFDAAKQILGLAVAYDAFNLQIETGPLT